jgi:hypothetical protein
MLKKKAEAEAFLAKYKNTSLADQPELKSKYAQADADLQQLTKDIEQYEAESDAKSGANILQRNKDLVNSVGNIKLPGMSDAEQIASDAAADMFSPPDTWKQLGGLASLAGGTLASGNIPQQGGTPAVSQPTTSAPSAATSPISAATDLAQQDISALTSGASAALGGYISGAANLLGAFSKEKEEYKFDPGVLEQAGAKTAGANALSAGASQVARAGNTTLAQTQNKMAQQVANQNNGASGLSAAMALSEGMSQDNTAAQNMAQAAQMQSQAQEQQASGQQFLNQNVRIVKKKELFGSEGLSNLVDGVKGLTGGFMEGASNMRAFNNLTTDSEHDKRGRTMGQNNRGATDGLMGNIQKRLSPFVGRAVGGS